MATGWLKEVEDDAVRLTTRRFEEQERDRLEAIEKKAREEAELSDTQEEVKAEKSEKKDTK